MPSELKQREIVLHDMDDRPIAKVTLPPALAHETWINWQGRRFEIVDDEAYEVPKSA